MRILSEYAQDIVNQIVNNLGHKIIIVDNTGIIIASGDKRRVNSYHSIAEKVILTEKMMVVTSEEAKNLKGVKPGINLPLLLNDKIIGAIGITGEPEDVLPFAELIKNYFESMLNQAFIMEQLRTTENATELFLFNLMNENLDNKNNVIAKASLLGIDLKIPRVAIAIKVNRNSSSFDSNSIKKQINEYFYGPNHLVFYNGKNSFAILYAVEKMENNDSINSEILLKIDNFKTILDKRNQTYRIGIGSFYPGLIGLKKSYREAMDTIEINEKIKNDAHISFCNEINLEFLLNTIQNSHAGDFKHRFGKNEDSYEILQDEKIVLTLNAFFNENLNVSKAADKLGISRITLSSYLDKVYESTGYNPRNFNDAIQLRTMIILRGLNKFEQTGQEKARKIS